MHCSGCDYGMDDLARLDAVAEGAAHLEHHAGDPRGDVGRVVEV